MRKLANANALSLEKNCSTKSNVAVEYFSRWKVFFATLPYEFRPALNAFLSIFIPSTLLLPLTYFAPAVTNSLRASRLTLWGVFTSIWIHDDVLHYIGNMLVLFLFLILFAFLHEDFLTSEKHRRSTVLGWIPLVSAVVANTDTLTVFPLSSGAGASGAVYAWEGICLGYAFINSYPSNFTFKGLTTHFKGQSRKRVLKSGVIFVALFISFALSPTQFLGVAPGVNALAHLVGFLVGFGLTGTNEITHSLWTGLSCQESSRR